MERRKFEEGFKDAFKDSGVSPADHVWGNIELDLMRAEGKKMKQRVLFYKLLAAASVTFAMCLAGINYYNGTLTNTFNTATQLAQNNAIQSPTTEKPDTAVPNKAEDANPNGALQSGVLDNNSSVSKRDFDKENGLDSQNRLHNLKNTVPALANETKGQPVVGTNPHMMPGHEAREEHRDDVMQFQNEIIAQADTNVAHDDANISNEREMPTSHNTQLQTRFLPEVYHAKRTPPVYADKKPEESTADPVALMFARLNDLERELSASSVNKKNASEKERTWTSVGFAAGGFNGTSNASQPSASTQLSSSFTDSNNRAASTQAKASGVAYSVGVNFGTHVSNRWVIQGGLNYLTQLSDYTATQALGSADFQNFKAASLSTSRADESKIIPTAPYTVNNSVRFVSLPVQAGYLVVKRRVGVQLNAGVSTDMFLQNTIDPQGSNLDKTTQSRGDDSPYRSVNFSGLVGTEFSYKFSDRYRVALNPGLRYPLNSIYKDEVGIMATPLTVDVGLRFRYIFQ